MKAMFVVSTFLLNLLTIFILPSEILGTNCKENILCSVDYCTECKPNCKNSIDEELKCENGILFNFFEDDSDECGCCPPRCVEYLKENELCSPFPLSEFPKDICGPQLSCRQENSGPFMCLRGQTPCLQTLTEIETREKRGELGIFEEAPLCTSEGDYNLVQCSRNGPCRCVNKRSGTPLFGFEGSLLEAEASKMNCLCSHHYFEALTLACTRLQDSEPSSLCISKALESSAINNVYFPTHLRCTPNGNMDAIQCFDNSGDVICYCIDPLSLESTKEKQSLNNIHLLSCYTMKNENYYRSCENIVVRRQKEEEENEGFWIRSKESPLCSPDGYFKKVQIINELKTCVDRNGNPIEFYNGTLSDTFMNCECAFDSLYLDENFPRPSCCSNGNYRAWQCNSGFCYCVNGFGEQVGMEVDIVDLNQLNCNSSCLEL